MKVEVDYIPGDIVGDPDQWLMWVPEMPGVYESGASKQEAWNKLMISLQVKLLYDSGIADVEPMINKSQQYGSK